jgi:hypothetical protein
MILSEEDYKMHCDSYAGYCTDCKDITRDSDTEPDATDYECPDCEEMTCMGIEQALLEGHIEIGK